MAFPWWIFKKDNKKKLCKNLVYERIGIHEIPKASTLLWYGSYPWVTEKCGRLYAQYPYKTPPGHASFAMGGDQHLNQGAKAEIKTINFPSTRRIDVIIYKGITTVQRDLACEEAKRREGRPYDGTGFMWAGGLKLFRPLKWADYCSESVAACFLEAGIKVSKDSPKWCEPWDLQFWAWENPNLCEVRTLHIGRDFKG